MVRRSDGFSFPITTDVLAFRSASPPSISFDPGESNLNETYDVTINNVLRLSDGARVSFTYWVQFFDAEAP